MNHLNPICLQMTGLLSQQGLRDLNIVVSTNLNFPCQNYVFQCSSECPSMYMLKSVLNCSIFPTLPSEIHSGVYFYYCLLQLEIINGTVVLTIWIRKKSGDLKDVRAHTPKPNQTKAKEATCTLC